MRDILAAYGAVRREDIRGMRAPFLAVSSVLARGMSLIIASAEVGVTFLQNFVK